MTTYYHTAINLMARMFNESARPGLNDVFFKRLLRDMIEIAMEVPIGSEEYVLRVGNKILAEHNSVHRYMEHYHEGKRMDREFHVFMMAFDLERAKEEDKPKVDPDANPLTAATQQQEDIADSYFEGVEVHCRGCGLPQAECTCTPYGTEG